MLHAHKLVAAVSDALMLVYVAHTKAVLHNTQQTAGHYHHAMHVGRNVYHSQRPTALNTSCHVTCALRLPSVSTTKKNNVRGCALQYCNKIPDCPCTARHMMHCMHHALVFANCSRHAHHHRNTQHSRVPTPLQHCCCPGTGMLHAWVPLRPFMHTEPMCHAPMHTVPVVQFHPHAERSLHACSCS
jgi:hypothetical protein